MSPLEEALSEVYGGDQSLEASAVEDKLYDRQRVIVPVGFTYRLRDALAFAHKAEDAIVEAMQMERRS